MRAGTTWHEGLRTGLNPSFNIAAPVALDAPAASGTSPVPARSSRAFAGEEETAAIFKDQAPLPSAAY